MLFLLELEDDEVSRDIGIGEFSVMSQGTQEVSGRQEAGKAYQPLLYYYGIHGI